FARISQPYLFMKPFLKVIFGSILLFSACQPKHQNIDFNKLKNASTDWPHYGGPADGSRFSSLTQVTKENVAQLEVAWTYKTGDATASSQIQCQPIVVNGLLYGSTPSLNVFALNAGTGEEIWRFDPFEVLGGENSWAGTNRGVSYWEDGADKRILF